MENNKDNKEYTQDEDKQSIHSYKDDMSNILKNIQLPTQTIAQMCEQMRQIQQSLFTPEMSEMISNCAKVGRELIAKMNSDAIISFSKMALDLQSYKIEIPKIEIPKISLPYIPIPKIQIPEGLKSFTREYIYLKNLEIVEWPLFIYDNDSLKNRLIEYFDNCEDTAICNADIINSIVFEEITIEDIIRLADGWESSTVISANRIPILHEGIVLYKQGYYYGCVSLMMCQLEGIISDIHEMLSASGIKYTVEEAKMAYEHYTHKVLNGNIKLNREKNQLLCMMTKVENGIFYWIFSIGYIYNTLLTSKEEMNQSNHPCRNKVCHGIQTNFGTKEHALKAILSIDLLINFAEEMRRVVEASDEN